MQDIEFWHGDCLELMKDIPDNSIDLIMTSPPYAEQRKDTYGGVKSSQYVNWFLPISNELKRVLKPTGSFILNIKEHVENGQRSTYVLELVIALKQQGWLWTEEYIWCKPNPMPGKWPNRLKDGWEHCYHFTKEAKFNMYPDQVKIKAKSIHQRKKFSELDMTRREMKTGSGFGLTRSNFTSDMVLPSNVVTLATYQNIPHPAVYPKELPEFFIKLFTKEGDAVLDPFLGSGTTALVAYELGRNCIGMERMEEYYNLASDRINQCSNNNKQLQFEAAS